MKSPILDVPTASGNPFSLGCSLILAAGLALGVWACSPRCESGAICGDNNSVAPTTISTTTTNPSASPSPSATPGCLAQTAAFVCTTGGRLFESILLDAQRSVPPAPEPIYVLALVAELNKRADVCAIAGPSPDEITIKARATNTLSSTWDVVKADGTIQAITPLNNVCVPSRF
jgi:hypothetical protein